MLLLFVVRRFGDGFNQHVYPCNPILIKLVTRSDLQYIQSVQKVVPVPFCDDKHIRIELWNYLPCTDNKPVFIAKDVTQLVKDDGCQYLYRSYSFL